MTEKPHKKLGLLSAVAVAQIVKQAGRLVDESLAPPVLCQSIFEQDAEP